MNNCSIKKISKKIFTLCVIAVLSLIPFCGCSAGSVDYGTVKTEIERTATLENDYFANYYDCKAVDKAKDNAQEAIDNSDEDSYKDVYNELVEQNDALEEYISAEREKLFNKQTDETGSSKHPFSVKKSDFVNTYQWDPYITLSSKDPTNLLFIEAEVTDEGDTVSICTYDGDCIPCTYEIDNNAQEKLKVKTAKDKYEYVLANTEIKPHLVDEYQETYSGGQIKMAERTIYAFESKDGETLLALPSNDGDYYVMYKAF